MGASYFTEDTEKAISEYNRSENMNERNRIYSDRIYPALHKLCSIVYRRFGPYDYVEADTAIYDCVSRMTEILDKCDQSKGKAYSFLTISAYRHYVHLNRIGYKHYGVSSSVVLENIPAETDTSEYFAANLRKIQKVIDTYKLLKAQKYKADRLPIPNIRHPEGWEFIIEGLIKFISDISTRNGNILGKRRKKIRSIDIQPYVPEEYHENIPQVLVGITRVHKYLYTNKLLGE